MEERTRRISQESREVVVITWQAYKAIMANEHATFSIGDKRIYNSVRKRLRGRFATCPERLERFKLLK